MVFVFMYAKTLKRDLVQRDTTWDKRSLKQYGYLLVKSFRDNFYQKSILKTSVRLENSSVKKCMKN